MFLTTMSLDGIHSPTLRRIGRVLAVALAPLFLLGAAAQAQLSNETPTITVSPSFPTTQDTIQILIEGTSTDGCTPSFDNGFVNGFDVTINLSESTGPCTQALTPYSIGPISAGPLAAGTYQVRLFRNGQSFGSPKSFTVTQFAGGETPTITVTPFSPTTQDIIQILIEGTSNDGCTPSFVSGSVNGFNIDINLSESTGPCTQVVTPYTVGPISAGPLAAGTYQVRLFRNGQPFGSPKSFTVTQFGGGETPTITVTPSSPTTQDTIQILIEGTSNDGCTPSFVSGSVNGFNVDLNLSESTGPCTQVVTSYSIGPIFAGPLAAGTYQVRLFRNGQSFGSPKTFTVTQFGGGGGCSDLTNGIACVQNDRFEMTMTWEQNGVTKPVYFTSDGKVTAFGYFPPALADNVVTAKVTKGCSLNGFYWVWLGSFTKGAQLEMTVRDRQTGRTKQYRNIKGSLMTTIKDDTFFSCN